MRASRRVFRRLRASSIIRAFREDAVIRIISFFGALALAIVSAAAFAQDKPEASNMRLVGYDDLQGRSAYPAHPKLVTRIVEGLKGTHKSWWECDTGFAYLVSGEPGWRVARMTQIYDLSDPAHPVKIRDFGLPGQQPGASGATPTMLHGMISMPQANRVYFGYGTNEGGILQIVDRDKLLNGPKEPTDQNLRYPETGRFMMSPLNGAHTTFPVLEMPIAEFAKDKIGKVRN